MGAINIAGWGLLFGAGGQALFLVYLFPNLPGKILFAVLLIPWLAVYTISFCRVAPCGPRAFRRILIFAMGWYTAATLLAEILCFIRRPVPHGPYSLIVPRVLMYFGALTFIVFVRVCITLCRLEASSG
jgi:hypothetical protein